MKRELTNVSDVEVRASQNLSYDIGLFASGYETRSRAFAATTHKELIRNPIVVGFEDHADKTERKTNDKFYLDKFGNNPNIVGSNNPRAISDLLDMVKLQSDKEVRLLVDVSSMGRSWYADVLNWARYATGPDSVIIDFVYYSGKYPENYPTRNVTRTVSLTGFEGRSNTRLETVALLGLGYDAITPMSVLEDLQPELKYGFVAFTGNITALNIAIESNQATIEQLDGAISLVPLMSVASAYRMLSEMVAPHTSLRNVVFVCLGPKTHVLASLLVATKNEEITCLHTQGAPAKSFNVLPGSEISVVRAEFIPAEQ